VRDSNGKPAARHERGLEVDGPTRLPAICVDWKPKLEHFMHSVGQYAKAAGHAPIKKYAVLLMISRYCNSDYLIFSISKHAPKMIKALATEERKTAMLNRDVGK
jgi:hypothetical protein